MKQFKFLSAVVIAAGMSFILSCNSGEDKKPVDAPDTTAAKTPDPTPPPPPPPMLMRVMHKVSNFAKWLPSYEAHDSMRNAYGLHNFVIARGTKDTNMVMVVVMMDNPDKAKEFAAQPGLKDAMKKGGVIGAPMISYINTVMLDRSDAPNPSRVLVTHKVKDWDAWKKVFDGDKPNREAAGLTDRSLGYEVGDNHMVTMSFIVADMKKAEDFSKSETLKKKMEEAGVEGPPTMFYYTIVKKY